MPFVREHFFKILISIIVSLVAIIGKNELHQLQGDLKLLQCDVAFTTAVAAYQDFELELFEFELDDLNRDSPPIVKLKNFLIRFDSHLLLCEDGIGKKTELKSLLEGLYDYFDKDYGNAVTKFGVLDHQRSLTHRVLGSAKYHQSETAVPGDVPRLREQSINHFLKASRLSRNEIGTSSKQSILARQQCRPQIVKLTSDGNQAAIYCLKDVVEKGYDNYNTHYNLSAIYSREKEYDNALISFSSYLKEGGKENDNRSVPENDEDFSNYILKDPDYAPQFKALLGRMKQ